MFSPPPPPVYGRNGNYKIANLRTCLKIHVVQNSKACVVQCNTTFLSPHKCHLKETKRYFICSSYQAVGKKMMHLKHVVVAEGSVTRGAHKQLVTCVNLHMFLDIIFV
jgi:hypothetical protein